MGPGTELLKVVVVSPGDVMKERVTTRTVVDELNRGVAAHRGCQLSLWRWETDARTGMHLDGPQGLIDAMMDITEADIVIGVFWKRFGTPTVEADSGTEHELRRAWAAWRERQRPEVMVYFCRRAYAPKSPSELAQWQRVLEFQRDLPGQQLWWEYRTVRDFEALLREHLTRIVLARPASPRRGRVRFNLPAITASFTGRHAELDALEDALETDAQTVVTQVIAGLGGVGKSQLAAHYVRRHLDHYDVVAWIRGEEGGTADLARLAARLGEPVVGLAPGECAQYALDALSDTEQRWLLVLDDVESPQRLEELSPRTGRGRVLVTSRDRAMGQFGQMMTLEVFDEQTAIEYLVQRARRPGDETAARRLAAALGFLPLALSHAAAFCQSGTSFAEYLDLLRDLPASDLFEGHPELSYAKTVASTWKASIHAARAKAPMAAELLEMAAHMAAAQIPRSLVAGLADEQSALERRRRAHALNALARFSLLTLDGDMVSMHHLLQKAVRDDAAARGDTTAALLALAALDAAFPADAWHPTQWARCALLLPHALALADSLSQPGDGGPQLIALLDRACDYLICAGPGKRPLASVQAALGHAIRIVGVEHPTTLSLRHSLGIAYRLAWRTAEAMTILIELLDDRERILGTEHRETLSTLHSVADVHLQDGRIDEAVAILTGVCADRERILGAEHRDTLRSRRSLGAAYREAGRISEAITILEPLRGEYERLLGPEDSTTLSLANEVALAYRQAGRIDEAIAILEAIAAAHERTLGPTHRLTFAVRSNLGALYSDAGRFDDAIAIIEALLSDGGPREPADDSSFMSNSLATAYLEVGRTDEAITILEPLLADVQRVQGPVAPATLVVRNNLASAYLLAGRTAGGIGTFEALIADAQRRWGAEHPDILVGRRNLASAHLLSGRIHEAVTLLEALRADCERILGARHPHTLATCANLAYAYRRAWRFRDARRVRNEGRIDRS